MREIDILKKSITDSDFSNKEELLNILKCIEGNLKNKKYGLVWEDKTENIKEDLKNNFVYLEEDKEKRITKNKNNLENILIEGDNLESLMALQYTHKELIDFIYIDPPYNLEKDFIYNDKFVGKDDSYKHSKWLSFMHKRLNLAKNLLNKKGVMFISIDETEMCQLKLLCDDLFGEKNCIGIFSVKTPSEVSTTDKIKANEFLLIYSKVENSIKLNGISKIQEGRCTIGNEGQTQPEILFPKGLKVVGVKDGVYKDVRKTGGLEDLTLISDSIHVCNGELSKDVIFKARWRNPNDMKAFFEKMMSNSKESIFNKFGKEILDVYLKGDRFQPQMIKCGYELPKTIISEYTQKGSEDLKNIIGPNNFDYPKSVELIKYFISLHPNKNALILDFFAGSGTTGQSILEINKHDNGERRFILCTNNENNICKDITYQRIYKIINGYKNQKGKDISGIEANLRYYRTKKIEKTNNNELDQFNLLNKTLELIQIKENAFEIVQSTNYYSILNNNDKVVGLYSFGFIDSIEIEKMLDELIEINKENKVAYVPVENVSEIYDYINNQYIGLVRFEKMPKELIEIYNKLNRN